MPHAIRQKDRPVVAREDEVAIHPLDRVEARREPGRSLLDGGDRDAVVHQRVERAFEAARRAGGEFVVGEVEADHLPARMHARIGAAGAHGLDLAPVQCAQRSLDRALHRQLPRLTREPAKRRAVIGDGQGNGVKRAFHDNLSTKQEEKSSGRAVYFPPAGRA